MSSQSSLNSTLSPTATSPLPAGRRRTQSLSANAPNVITTDRVRPDWATKLAAQRAHQARRAAAATALHTAAFLIGNNESRPFAFTRPGRFSRRNTGASSGGGGSSNNNGTDDGVAVAATVASAALAGDAPLANPGPGPRGSSGRGVMGRRSRMEELEDMMFMEAVRLSLAAEEERKRRAEKDARKEAKKREKEERKALKQQQRHTVYSGSQSPGSGSSLSLGLGRRRGNSVASNLRVEATLQGALNATTSDADSATSRPAVNTSEADDTPAGVGKGKGVDRGAVEGTELESPAPTSSTLSTSLPIPSPSHRGPSHLRQMSNASSISSSLAESLGSHNPLAATDDAINPNASGVSLARRSEDRDRDRDPGGAGMEPMFNFRSLAEMVGVQIEGETETDISTDSTKQQPPGLTNSTETTQVEEMTDEAVGESVATLTVNTKQPLPGDSTMETKSATSGKDSPPEVLITPDTPGLLPEEKDNETKTLSVHTELENASGITQ
jgi:hypothetical protein